MQTGTVLSRSRTSCIPTGSLWKCAIAAADSRRRRPAPSEPLRSTIPPKAGSGSRLSTPSPTSSRSARSRAAARGCVSSSASPERRRLPRRRQLIVVSNRGPVTFDRAADGTRVERRGGGGLVTALRGLLEHHDVTWIASAMTEEDRRVAAEGGHGPVVLVAHDPDAYDAYYNVVANPMLWFIQHSLWGRSLQPELDETFHAAWRGYEQVNESFAAAVVAELDNTPEAEVLFQDYHLYLAPAHVRAARPGAVLAHFVHTPWPGDWTTLPPAMRRAVHEGLLANDVVAFHTERWARAFHASCAEVVGGCGRTHVRHHAISIDTDEFCALRESADVRDEESRILDSRPEKLVVRVDRTDPSKNIVRGFHAFGLLLETHPEWRGRIRMLALLDPSRQSIPEYSDYVAAVGGRVQAVRRAARECRLRRHESRREGSAARERSRRCARALGKRGRVRGARGVVCPRQSLRHRGPG